MRAARGARLLDLQGVSLVEIRARIALVTSSSVEGRLLRALERDPRLGARALAEVVARRIAARRSEARRVSRLFALRRALMTDGARTIAGVDEVGVGPLAGPVVAAAVVLPRRVDLPGLNDSKQVPRADRERLDRLIRAQALAVSVAEVASTEVDRINVLRASIEAMRQAVQNLGLPLDHVFVDAHTIPVLGVPQTALIDGDAREGTIAAASIVAKVHRDALMRRLDAAHPGYGFGRHKGYATQEHLSALARLGPSPQHRRSFAPVSQLLLL